MKYVEVDGMITKESCAKMRRIMNRAETRRGRESSKTVVINKRNT